MGWLTNFPPLYIATLALIAGDALGNAGLYVPIGFAIVIALAAAGAYLANRPRVGGAIAFAAITAAATIPVHNLLTPVRGPISLYRFADNSTVIIEGLIVREPERIEDGRSYLYVRLVQAGTELATLGPTTGAVRVTIRGEQRFVIGDESPGDLAHQVST